MSSTHNRDYVELLSPFKKSKIKSKYAHDKFKQNALFFKHTHNTDSDYSFESDKDYEELSTKE